MASSQAQSDDVEVNGAMDGEPARTVSTNSGGGPAHTGTCRVTRHRQPSEAVPHYPFEP